MHITEMLPVIDRRGKGVQSLVPACSPLWGFSLIICFFKDLTEANRQPGINLKGIFFLSSALNWSLKCVVLHSCCLSPHHRALTWLLFLTDSVTWVRLSPVEEKCTGRQGRRRISISTISKELMSFSELRLLVLLKHTFHNASLTCKPCKPQSLVGCPLCIGPHLTTQPLLSVWSLKFTRLGGNQ